MNKLFRRSILSMVFLSVFIFGMPLARAETHITTDTAFGQIVTWTKSGSPYILDDDIYIPHGVFLSIGPGVTVTTSSSSPGSLDVGGTLAIYGSVDEPVTITNLTDFSLLFSTSTISNAVIDVPTGLNITAGYIEISSSTIADADHGIDARGATLQISNSVISRNHYGIYSHSMPPPVFQAFNPFRNFFGFRIANAQVFNSDNPRENHISISSSSVMNNSLYDIYNSTGNVVNAQNNWWGSSSGPASSTFFGNVDYTPWLVKDPRFVAIVTPCCSNVLFLPGIEASRLYLDQKDILGTSTNELWEPNRNADVQKLFMTQTGQSINSGIYTKDVIDSALGLPWSPIYKGFIAMMNGVVADKIINSWLPYPYDWRFGVDSIVSPALVNAIQSLASTSKTGKVTIVAHSNGGLIAKLLTKTLVDKGESGLLDKVILVAVPQLGTPQAIPGLLHGDNESLAGGLILTQSIARQLAENMPGAYGLLPSRGYFSNATSSLFGSIVSFASSTLADFNLVGDKQMISNYDALRSFLIGISDHRDLSSATDTQSPTLLHTAMIDASQKIHDIIDTFSFASTTQAIILAGWGNPTLYAISYFEKKNCSDSAMTVFFGTNPKCTNQIEHSASTTIFGDGTVILQSAAATIVNSLDYYFDLGSENKSKMISDDHSDILSTDSGVAFVKQEITASSSSVSTSSAQPTLPPYISSSAPTMADAHEDDLVVSVHSPVELNIYDSQGRHTGPIPNPIQNSDLGMYETGIPGSQYVPNDGDTYVRVPYGTDYRVTFIGTGMGSFEVDTQHNVNDVIVANTTFADMPVTPLLKAELVLATTTQSSATSTSSTTQMMLFDFNGDGTIDATSTPHDAYDPILDMESYQSIVSKLGLSPYKEKILHDKLAYIIDCLRKKKPLKEVKNPDKQAIALATKAVTDIKNQHWVFKNLDFVHKQQIEDIFEAFIDDVDTSQ